MNVFNLANKQIRMLLIEEAVFPIDLDNTRIEGWLYQSEYPFQLMPQKDVTKYQFKIRLYQFDSMTNSYKVINWLYKSAPKAKLVYVDNYDIDSSVNQMGKDFIETEKFNLIVMPLLLEGYREEAFKVLMNSNNK